MQRAAAAALPRDFGYEWTGVTFQELKAGSIATVVFGAGDRLRLPDPRRAIRELDDAVHGAARPRRWRCSARSARSGSRQMQIDVYSQIGFVMLIGLAAKNAILIVEFAKRRREEGLSIVEAAMEAGRLRLRPILMTAFAFIFGVMPLMFATGAGAASRQSIGTTVFGGMVAATTLTLIFVPVFYALIERCAKDARRRPARHARRRPSRAAAPRRPNNAGAPPCAS